MQRLLSPILSSILASAILLNPLARAAERPAPNFAELVRNHKESGSILLNSEDVAESETVYPSDNADVQTRLVSAFSSFAKSMDATDGERAVEACEPLVLSRLQAEIAAAGLAADPTAIRFALLLLRKKNLIDDVTLYPLLAAYPAWAAVGYVEKDWVRKDADGRTVALDCPTNQYSQIYFAAKNADGRKAKRKDIVERIESAAKEKNENGEARFPAFQIAWLDALHDSGYDPRDFPTLSVALTKVAKVKNVSPRADPTEAPTSVMSKRKKKGKGLSNRLALYARYDGIQIDRMTELYRAFVARMDLLTSEATLVLKYKDGRPDETYALSPEEQYRMAAKWFHKDIVELAKSKEFSGGAPTFDEVVIACLETGDIRAKEFDTVMKVDDIWNPSVSTRDKILKVVKKYGGTLLVLIPSPISFWASLVVTIAQTLPKLKAQANGSADDRGISLF